MRYTPNEYSGLSSGSAQGGASGGQGAASQGAGQGAGQGNEWGSRVDRADGEGPRAFAVSVAPTGQPAANQPPGSQAAGPAQFASSYSTGSTGGPSGGLSASAPGANGANRSILGTLVIRPLPGEEGGQTREIVLDGRDVAIGRSPACDVVLEGDQLVSRRHALLRATNGQYTIVDLGSSNGTYINETEIHQNTPLSDGDLITIGEHEIVFSTRPASAVAPSAVGSGSLAPAREQRSPVSAATSPYPAQGSVQASDLFDVSAAQTLLEPHMAQPAGPAVPAEAVESRKDQRMDQRAEQRAEPRNEPSWTQPAPAQPYPSPAQPTPLSLGGPAAQPQYPAPYRPEERPMPPAAAPQPAPQPAYQPATQQPQQASQYPPVSQAYQLPYQPQTSQPGAPVGPASLPSYGPAVRGGATGSARNTSAYLRAVRTQLDEANQRLAQAEEEESRLAEQRRGELAEVRDRLNAILSDQRQGPYGAAGYAASAYGAAGGQPSQNVAGLITLARQTEQNPRQIDYMMQLASRAGEIATALESAQSAQPRQPSAGAAPQALLSQLEALRARLDDLLS